MTTPRDPTQFTRESAERIARVVRAAELETPAAASLQWMPLLDPRKVKAFRVCTFTGAWSIGSLKAVTFKYQTATPNTASVINLFFPVTGTAAGDRDCAIAKEGTAWFLIDVPFRTATAVFVGATQSTSVMTDVTLSASLNTSACTISIGKTLVTSSITIVSSTFTSTFLRIDG